MAIGRTVILAAALAGGLAAGVQGANAAEPAPAREAVALVELFTSQGCSSCPPADKLLGELRNRPGIVALSFPVDYWDYLGWKDTFGSPANTARQKAYAAARGDGQVYTPQVVVNGQVHAVGSQRGAVAAAIAEVALPASHPALKAALKDRMLAVDVGGAEGASGTVWLAEYTGVAPVEVKRGENGGSTVDYHNVVRRLVKVGAWNGTAQSFSAELSAASQRRRDGCVVFLQEHEGGRILAAIDLPGMGPGS